MPALQKDLDSKLLKMYYPPFKGTWKTLPSYALPDDVVQDSMNVTLLAGKLRSRAGLRNYDQVALGNKVIGSFLNADTQNNKYPLCSTKDKFYRYHQGAWEDRTTIVNLTATDDNQVRMTSLQLGQFIYTLYTNGKDTLKIINQADYLLSEILPHAGTIPVCTDICTSFSRFVGITPPYTVTWCDSINSSYPSFTNWPSLNQAILADTEDSLVAIRPLGTLGIALYKEGNIFTGFNNAGSNAAAFRFEHRGEFEGPAGVNAIVNVMGTHIYMTPTGRISAFDGSQHINIADGLWPYLQDNLDTQYAKRIFGVYNYRTSEITFWYPRIGESGELRGMVTLNMPYPLAGVNSISYFLGQSSFACTNGLSIRLFGGLASPLIFGSEDNDTFILDRNYYYDDITPFTCSFKTGVFRPQIDPMDENPSDIYKPTVEVYANRGLDKGRVNVNVLTSQMLEDDGLASKAETLDLTEMPISEYVGFNDSGGFLGVGLQWDSYAKFEYKGCDVYGKKV